MAGDEWQVPRKRHRWSKDSAPAKTFLEVLLDSPGPWRSRMGKGDGGSGKDKGKGKGTAKGNGKGKSRGKDATSPTALQQAALDAAKRAREAEKRAEVAERSLADAQRQLEGRTEESPAMPAGDAAMADSPAVAPRPSRPVAPELSRAEAESKARALESSAEALRAVGLTERAAELEAAAAEQRKRAQAPAPCRRLEALEAWIRRAENRLNKAEQKVQEAKDALTTANTERDALEEELRDGQERLRGLREERLQQLRGELSAADCATDGSGGAASKEAREQQPVDLQSRFGTFRAASEEMHTKLLSELQVLQGGQVQNTQRHERLVALGTKELTARLGQCHRDHSAALGAGQWDAAASLAQSMLHLSAAMRDADAADKRASAAAPLPAILAAKGAELAGPGAEHRDAPF